MRIAVAVGTRPEAIKLAPVIAQLRRRRGWETLLVATGQHRQLLDQALATFGLTPDLDLDLMTRGQSLPDLTGRVLSSMTDALIRTRPSLLVVQGDTTTVFASTLAAFYQGIPVAHVEAGLRTADVRRPFPEEANRRLTSVLAAVHFAPTQRARGSLLDDNVPAERIAVTGNTVVDTALEFRRAHERTASPSRNGPRRILVTCHRRENWGEDLRNICRAIRRLVALFEDIEVVFPVHLNPQVQGPVEDNLGDTVRVRLLPPLDYAGLMAELGRSTLVLTDSGGIQEEAPTFGVPVLVLRDATERPEACAAGVARVVGTAADGIVRAAAELLSDPRAHAAMVAASNPFGDGRAAERVVRALERWVEGERPLLLPGEEFDPTAEVPLTA